MLNKSSFKSQKSVKIHIKRHISDNVVKAFQLATLMLNIIHLIMLIDRGVEVTPPGVDFEFTTKLRVSGALNM